MSLINFPVERRFEDGNRVRFYDMDGNPHTGTITRIDAEARQAIVVPDDDPHSHWTVSLGQLEHVPRDEVTPLLDTAKLEAELLRRIRETYRDEQEDNLALYVEGRYGAPLSAPHKAVRITVRKMRLRNDRERLFQALGRRVTAIEAFNGEQ